MLTPERTLTNVDNKCGSNSCFICVHIIATAVDGGNASRYGRADVSASYVDEMRMTRRTARATCRCQRDLPEIGSVSMRKYGCFASAAARMQRSAPRRGPHLQHHLRADVRVLRDDDALLVRERPDLVQDRLVGARRPDVVEKAARPRSNSCSRGSPSSAPTMIDMTEVLTE